MMTTTTPDVIGFGFGQILDRPTTFDNEVTKAQFSFVVPSNGTLTRLVARSDAVRIFSGGSNLITYNVSVQISPPVDLTGTDISEIPANPFTSTSLVAILLYDLFAGPFPAWHTLAAVVTGSVPVTTGTAVAVVITPSQDSGSIIFSTLSFGATVGFLPS
ncbi:Hypothetical protein POVN_LOCUS65 [uncultured virus]|nr:Hypothetical protein POVN_LOCUS65 [uncultured virus]